MTTINAVSRTEIERVVIDRLAASQSFSIATHGPDGPWVAGAFFVESDPFTLELVLEQSGRTLRNITSEPRVAIVVAAGTPFEPFLQAQAEVEIVTGDADAAVRTALVAKIPPAAAFMGAPIVAVRLHVESWRATDVLNGWLPGKTLTREQ
jgi:uncharacterized protein YhbP (UPF0306 family)